MGALRSVGRAGVWAAIAAGAGVGTLAALSRLIDAKIAPQGRFIEVDGNEIHYVDQGVGPAIVLVHGLGGQSRNFTYGVADLLAAHFRVITIDRPGAGHSTRVSDADADLRSQADIVTRFLDALDIERPLLVGHSFGGALALAAALDNPGRYAGLGLIAPLVFPRDGAPPPTLRRLAIASPLRRKLVAWSVAIPFSLRDVKASLDGLFGPEQAPADFLTKAGGALGLRPKAFYATSTDAVAIGNALPGLAARYGELDLPISVLLAAGDRILDPALHGEKLAKVAKNVALTSIPGGHMLPVTQPDVVAEWISGVARRAEIDNAQ